MFSVYDQTDLEIGWHENPSWGVEFLWINGLVHGAWTLDTAVTGP